MSFFDSYPPVPEEVSNSDYLICYNFIKGSYTLYTTQNSYYFYHPINGPCLYLGSSSAYSIINNSWSYSSDSLNLRLRYNHLVYTTTNIYDHYDKSHYFLTSGSNDSGNTFCYTVSSTSIISDFFRSYLPVISVVVAACVLFIGFRKAWSFVINSLRGA